MVNISGDNTILGHICLDNLQRIEKFVRLCNICLDNL